MSSASVRFALETKAQRAKRQAAERLEALIKATEAALREAKTIPKEKRPATVPGTVMATFTRQLVTMLDSGVTILPSLDFIGKGCDHEEMQRVTDELTKDVCAGQSLSSAMRSHPNVFFEVYVGMVEAAEHSGQLIHVLHKLAELTERQVKMQQKIIAAVTYPAVILMSSMILTVGFIMGVLPQMIPMFVGLNVQLPLPTNILWPLNDVFPFLFLGLGALALGFKLTSRRRKAFWERHPELARRVWERALLVPIVGPLWEKIILTRMLFALTAMMEGGMAVTVTLEKCCKTCGNPLIQWKLNQARRAIIDGGSNLSQALDEHKVFPKILTQMLRAGEEAGHLNDMLKRATEVLDEDIEFALTDLTNSVEPLFMAGTGLTVGFVVIAAMLPMVQLLQDLK